MDKKHTSTGIKPFGYIPSQTCPITYQIGGGSLFAASSSLDDDADTSSGADTTAHRDPSPVRVDSFSVWPNGVDNNEPTVCKELIRGNRLLPSMLEKQISILYGSGPQLYREDIGPDGKVTRTYLKDEQIQAWLESWRENGIADDYKTYLNKCIRNYYYTEGVFSKYRFSRGARAGLHGFLPVTGLEHVSDTRARFCTRKDIRLRRDITQADFEAVMVGNWSGESIRQEYRVYPRLDFTNPLGRNVAINYSMNPNFGEEVYATNVFFNGIKEWIRGCNATPSYINSFLENALSARQHVIFPTAWMAAKRDWIVQLCAENAELKANGKDMKNISMGRGKAWTIEVGEVYSDDILEKYVQLELRKLTNFLSGRGKNQGKIYASRAFVNDNGEPEKWEINEVSQKYKEYIEALITYDKRSDLVLVAAKGIDPSISNITPDGTVSKSGADAFYNYMIYLLQQSIPEMVVCADLNYAIRLNFPDKYASGIRIGFFRPTVARQEDTTSSQRLENQVEQ